MQVKIKKFDVDMDVKTKGIEFDVRTSDGTQHRGDCYMLNLSANLPDLLTEALIAPVPVAAEVTEGNSSSRGFRCIKTTKSRPSRWT